MHVAIPSSSRAWVTSVSKNVNDRLILFWKSRLHIKHGTGHDHQSRSWSAIYPGKHRSRATLFLSAGSIWFCCRGPGPPQLLSLFHELPVINLWEAGNGNASKYLELQVPFIFFGSLLVGSALLPMAQNRKELALLGGTFLFGLGALEVCLRFGGYWFTQDESMKPWPVWLSVHSWIDMHGVNGK